MSQQIFHFDYVCSKEHIWEFILVVYPQDQYTGAHFQYV